MNKLGLYIHVPFCRKKCGYCDFYSLAGCEDRTEGYCSAVKRQMTALSPLCVSRTCDSIYFGGGTPSILPHDRLCAILRDAKKLFALSNDCEITIEANPATVDARSLESYRACGINRISFGVQTKSPDTLRRIGRLHDYGEALESIALAQSAGFSNISADLIYGLPGQTQSELSEAIISLADAGVTHLSLYGLKVEENTPFGRDKTLVLPDEDVQCTMYLDSVALLGMLGFTQYEISNFAKSGYESRHNLRYWHREEYLGFGPSAHSFFDGFRFCLPRDLDAYIEERDFSLLSPIYKDRVSISKEDIAEEELMLSLRLKSGCPLEKLYLSAENRKRAEDYVIRLVDGGYAEIQEGNLSLLPAGMLVSNGIISDLMLL